MKLESPVNQNYAATVVRVKTLVPLDNSDNLVGMPLFGLQAIVGKGTQIGDMGIVFPAECQLSDGFTRFNNLYRHAEKNIDPGPFNNNKGYLEDNRRVRAIKLLGHRSDVLYMPLSSLEWTIGSDIDKLKEGDTFDKLGGYDICQKYVVRRRVNGPHNQHQKRMEPRVDARVFPEHFDSTHWLRVSDDVPDSAMLIVTQKLHGSSIRIGNVPVKRRLSWRDRLARRFGVQVQEYSFDSVYGSRKVIKDANNPLQNHYYDTDLWSAEGHKLDGLVPENYIVYGELVGFTDSGSPIQSHYTYDCLPGTRKLYVYRVCFVNAQGTVADLSWDGVRGFCESTGLMPVPELWRGHKNYFDAEKWVDKTFRPDFTQALPLSSDSPCDEGVCIRIEGMIPEIYKHKSPLFLQHETKLLDREVEDIEADQSELVLA
jgi:hypothetical protein